MKPEVRAGYHRERDDDAEVEAVLGAFEPDQ